MPSYHIRTPGLRRSFQSAVFVACVLGCMVALGIVFYVRGGSLMEQQVRSKLREVAAVAAQQFDGGTLELIQQKEDMEKPEFSQIVRRLQSVRAASPDIRFVYIMRRTDDANTLQFVADADSISTPDQLDHDKSGEVDTDEEASYPGDTYDISDAPALQEEAFLRPTVDEEVTTDQWGTFISGYAPILDRDGKAVAILGVDMDAKHFLSVSRSIFSPILFLLSFLAALLLAGYAMVFIWMRKNEGQRTMDQERAGILRLTSHQLGELLTIFQWSLEDIKNNEVGEEDRKSAIKNIETGTGRLRHIMGVLRSASRVEAGEFAYKPEWVYLRDVIMDAVRGMDPALKQKKLKVSFNLDGNLRLQLDKHLIDNVLRELLQNAADFSLPGAAITVSCLRHKKNAIVTVQDKGCGIPKQDLPRIFTKFVRGSNAHLSRPDGYGLGLFIAQRIIERAGGDMWIDSLEGEGTTVSFSLPVTA